MTYFNLALMLKNVPSVFNANLNAFFMSYPLHHAQNLYLDMYIYINTYVYN